METRLSENIRAFRKERGLTQEQLAEALQVSAGVISKWELGVSTPELGTIVDLADFFGISVDVLLGYQLRDRSRARLLEELQNYIHDRSAAVPFDRVEKGLKQFPNDFQVVYRAATLYFLRGSLAENRKQCLRSLELMEQAAALIGQNDDPKITLIDIRAKIAAVYRSLGRHREAVELLQQNNPCGVHDVAIGYLQAAWLDLPEEAEKTLSGALVDELSRQINVAMGLQNVYEKQGRWEEMIQLADWILGAMNALRPTASPCWLDPMTVEFWAARAYAHLQLGRKDTAREDLQKARTVALAFDAAPDYSATRVRFAKLDQATSYGDFGATALDGADRFVAQQKDAALAGLWQEVRQRA